jgi:hypothetical protein
MVPLEDAPTRQENLALGRADIPDEAGTVSAWVIRDL